MIKYYRIYRPIEIRLKKI